MENTKLALLRGVIGIVQMVIPSIVFFMIAVALFRNTTVTFGPTLDLATFQALAVSVIIICIALIVAYLVRRLLLPTTFLEAATQNATDVPMQDRLAREVVSNGIKAIGLISMVLVVLLAIPGSGATWQTPALSVFTSVLPVLSTWVGTVLAFYFTKESFRQAAENTQGLADRGGIDAITRPGTMVQFENIVRREMTLAEIGGRDAQIAAADLDLTELQKFFQPPGISRIIIFDDKKLPIFVLRHSLMPQSVKSGDTLSAYLQSGANKDNARNFAFAARVATIADARRLLQTRKVTDLFVTEHGRSDEPTLGWVPDDNIRGGV